MTSRQAAADRIRKFIDEYKKMRGLHPEMVYEIHAGDDHRQAAITIADLEALLAQPEPEGVTMDCDEIDVPAWHRGDDFHVYKEGYTAGWAAGAISGYARPTIKPVPVAERLPEPEDCCGNPRNGQGQWCWGRVRPQTDAGTPVVWRLMLVECLIDEATHWLPHHALPVPGAEVGND